MRASRGTLLLLCALLLLPAAAAAQAPTVETTLTPDGHPQLTAGNGSAGAAPRWRACAPDCGAVVAEGQSFAPGPTAAGTTFEVTTTSADGTTATGRSPVWRGRVAAGTPPTVTGEPRIGRAVSVAPGAWTGGWGDEFSVPGLRACRTPEATDCRQVAPRGSYGVAERSIVADVDPAFAGWYLGATEHRYGRGTAFPAIAMLPPPLGTPAERRPVAPVASATVALGPLVGPVPAARAGTPPRVAGRFAVGRKVTPRAGTWPDAPDGGRIDSAVRACPTRQDTDRCVLLHALTPGFAAPGDADPDDRPGPGAPVALGREHLGWYLGAVDRHRPIGGTEFVPAPSSPGVDRSVPALDVVTVHGPLGPTPVALGFTPGVSLLRRVARGPRPLRIGTVRCAERCVARLTLRAGGRTVRRRLVVRAGRPAPIVVRAATFPRARAIRTTVAFDHHPRVVRRTVAVR